MPENPASPPTVPEIHVRLKEIARLLRASDTLDAESQQSLAELVDEITSVLQTENLPPAEVAHLAETTAHLEETLRHHPDRGVIAKARAGLERVVSRAATSAPVTVGLAQRLLDVLASIGI